jgi:hypothetical protein
MAKTIETEVEIAASAERVWKVLTDFDAFPAWNPFVKSVEGPLEQGSKLQIRVQQPNGGGMKFSPKLLVVDPNRELRWLGRLLIPRLFDGEHYFTIEPLEENRVRFIHGETFRGVMIPFCGGMLEKTRHGFEQMNDALKARAEAVPQTLET